MPDMILNLSANNRFLFARLPGLNLSINFLHNVRSETLKSYIRYMKRPRSKCELYMHYQPISWSF